MVFPLVYAGFPFRPFTYGKGSDGDRPLRFSARQLAALKGGHRFTSMCRHQRFEPGDPPAGLENIHLATESIGIILVPPHDRLQ